MKKKVVFAFIGGDQRQRGAIYLLAQEGYLVKVFGFSDILHENVQIYDVPTRDFYECHVLMLPIPYKNSKGQLNIVTSVESLSIDSILGSLSSEVVVILGKADALWQEAAKNYGISYYDIVEEESFSVLNAIPSAEGAIQRAMERTDITLHGANILILGYGRIGKVLGRMLKSLGANVCVEARKNEDMAWIYEESLMSIHLKDLDTVLGSQDIVFNTIPHPILTRERLSKIRSGCIVIDLASHPGGTDFKAAEDFGIRANLDLSLPGIVAPKTAAKIVCQVTKEIMQRHFHYDIMGG